MRYTFKGFLPILMLVSILICRWALAETEAYPVVDTGQDHCYGNSGEIACPISEERFYGQDAQYKGHSPAYRDNGDGTVTDLITGLMWQKGMGEKRLPLKRPWRWPRP